MKDQVSILVLSLNPSLLTDAKVASVLWQAFHQLWQCSVTGVQSLGREAHSEGKRQTPGSFIREDFDCYSLFEPPWTAT